MFKNMKLALKIGGGFFIVLILTAAVGFIGWNGMNGVVDRVVKGDDVNRLVKDMLETRQAEKNFILREDQEYAGQVATSIATIKKQATETKAKFEDPANQKQMDDILAAIGNYEKAFDNYIDLFTQAEESEAVMVNAARDVESKSDEIREEQKIYIFLNLVAIIRKYFNWVTNFCFTSHVSKIAYKC